MVEIAEVVLVNLLIDFGDHTGESLLHGVEHRNVIA